MDIKTIFQSFKDRWMGNRVDTDDYPKGEVYQCVDLVKQYLIECFGIPNGAYGDAIDYWNKTAAVIRTKFTNMQTTAVQTGDIVVLRPNHIGIATGNVKGDTFELFEQNGSTGNGSGTSGDAIRTRYIPFTRIAGLLRANGAVATPTPTPSYTSVNVGRILVMPASVTVWHFYKVGGPYTLSNAQGTLAPQKFGGLEYPIQANPQANIYVINTQMFGQVAVYAGPDTAAQFKDQPSKVGHPYTVEQITPKQVVTKINATEWNLDNTTWGGFNNNPVSTLAPGNPITVVAIAHHNLGGKYYMKDANTPHGFNVVDCEDYTAPAQPAETPETAPNPSRPQNIVYTKLERPQSLIVNKSPTHVWRLDFDSYPNARSMVELAQGTPFIAYGKAQRTDIDRPAYFMTEGDFGSADTTGVPINNNGVNTVDLSPAPQPAETPAAEPAAAEAVEETAAENIPVKVLTPTNPDAWKTTFKTNAAGDYVANADTKVYDIAAPTNPVQQLEKGLLVHVAGTFTGPNGVKYYRTKKSTDEGTWYGIPEICLSAEDLDSDHDILLNNNVITEAREELGRLNIRERIIRFIATLQAILDSMFHKK